MKNGLFKKWLAAALCVLALGSTAALAEPDSFGLGDGHNGPLTVSGTTDTINSYAQVTGPLAPGDITLPVGTCTGDPSCFKAGDLVMVLQTTGIVPVPVSGGTGPLNITNDAVGRWELARLSSATGSALTLRAPLVHSYAASVTQVIRVPEYTDVTIDITGSIVARPWDRSTGGVVAFLATGNITHDGSINAGGAGFLGGAFVNESVGKTGCTGLDETGPSGAFKGEGIANTRFGPGNTGRGNVANAGGGGVCFRSGGGGGGNAGAGGLGGNSADGGGRPVGGMGGVALTYSMLNHLTFGGGGGAGHGSTGAGQAGGNGGGIIFIRANQLTGGGILSASGAFGGSSNTEAASGGGGGGSVYLRFVGTADCGGVDASGGLGGSTNALKVGPGGGGGGGRVLIQSEGGVCVSASNSVIGANPGSQKSGTVAAAYGAMSGDNGIITSLSYGFILPAVPTVTTPANGLVTTNRRPEIRGKAEADTMVVVYINDVVVGRARSNSSGDFILLFPSDFPDLPEGSHKVQAAAEVDEVQSPKSAANTFTVDLTPPVAPVVLTPANKAVLTTGRPTVTGTAEANSTVTVYIDGSVVGTVKADGSGNWNYAYTPAPNLPDGGHTVKATSTDAAGNTSIDSNVNAFTVDTKAPDAPTVTAPSEGASLATTTPAITGKAEANSTVTVILDDKVVGTVTADGSGNWSYTPATPLPDGDYAVKATSTDAAGNISVESNVRHFSVDTLVPPAPVVVSPLTGSVLNDPRPAITGTAEPHSTLTLSIDGIGGLSVVVIPVDGSGNWSYTPTTNLLDGSYTVKATATDKAGNTSVESNQNTFIVDTAKPAVPTVTAPAEGARLSVTQPVITGTAEAHSTVTIIIDGKVAGTVTADADGHWSYTPATPLPDGDYAVKATSKDAAGNTSDESNVRHFTVDTLVPPAPVVVLPAMGSVVNSVRPAITGTAEPHSTVTVFIDGKVAGTTTADGSGNWSFTPTVDLPDGSYTAKATATDAAGNTGVESNQNTFTVDTVMPPAPVVTTPGEGTLVTTSLPVITGTAEPGSTVTIIIDGKPVGSATADGSGNWSYTPATALTDGPHEVKATSTDVAGNTSPESSVRHFSVDTAAPDTLITAVPSSPSNSSNATFEFGSNETGVTYECRLEGATAFSACSASETFTGLADGTHELEVRARDAAGNVDPTPATYRWTVDLTPPTAPVVTGPASTVDSLTPAITGTAEPGSTVTVIIDGQEVGTVRTDSAGHWSYTPATPLTVGPHEVVVRATDEAGNTGGSSSSHSFTVAQDTTAPDTTLTSGPSGTTSEHGATFEFSANEEGVTYECSLDGAAFTPCTSPAVFTGLSEGEHTFQVRARDAAGNVDPTPATRTWTVSGNPDPGNAGGDIAFLGDGFGCSATGGDSSLVLMGLGTFLALARRRRR